MTVRKAPRRWSRDRSDRYGHGETYRLNCGMVHLVTAQQLKDDRWYWYGLYHNTSSTPRDTLDQIKDDVKRFLDSDIGRIQVAAAEARES